MYKNVQERMSVGTKKHTFLCVWGLFGFYFIFPTEYFWLYEKKNYPTILFQAEELL